MSNGKNDMCVLKVWYHRQLTLMGKILIINTLILSHVVYYFTNMYNPPEKFLQILKKKFCNIFGKGKKARLVTTNC